MKTKQNYPVTEKTEIDGKIIASVMQDNSEHNILLSVLQQSDSPYVQLLNMLSAAIYTCDASGRITFFNDAAVYLWGRRPVIGKDMWCGSWKIYDTAGNDLPLDSCPMAVTLREGKAVAGQEIIVERPDGIRLNVMPYPQPILDSRGQIAGAVNLLIDVTELRRTGKALIESEERFRTLADQSPIIVWMTDVNGKWNYANRQWMQFTGKPHQDGIEISWTHQVHPDDRQHAVTSWGKAFEAREKFQCIIRYADKTGSYINAQITGNPRYSLQGQFVGYIGIIQDITLQESLKATLETLVAERTRDLVRKNEELRQSEERYHRMIAEVQDYAIILLDQNGIIENWNKGAEKIKGYSAYEIIGKSFKVFYSDEDQESKLPERLIDEAKENGRATHEGWRVRKDGAKFWGSIVITSLHDDNNNLIGFSKVTRDLTEKRNADLELVEKNRELETMNQDLSSFAYVSSHDLQEPLRKIQTFAARISEIEGEKLSEKGKDYFQRMQNAALRMQTLIEDLLSYSRTNTAEKKFEMTDLNQLLKEVQSELAETIDEKKAVIQASPLPILNVIPFQTKQLLSNILSNALKFSKADEPPRINITTDLVKGKNTKNSHVDQNRSYRHIAIRDNGIGFEPEHTQKIFEVFQRLHGRSEYSGTGIGLAICKKIMDNHHGLITAESELDQGATFHLYFPV
jgi:PAS domain S-box-containing protein